MAKPFYLAPSDAYFLLPCERCTWLKLRHGIRRPFGGFPKVLQDLTSASSAGLLGFNLAELGGPDAVLSDRERQIWSDPISHQGERIKTGGRVDFLAKEAASVHVIDAKLTNSNAEDLVERYGPQLNLYHWSFANPERGRPIFIDRLFLLAVRTEIFTPVEKAGVFQFSMELIEVPVMDPEPLLKRALEVAMNPTFPPPSKDCPHCSYLIDVYELAQKMGKAEGPAADTALHSQKALEAAA